MGRAGRIDVFDYLDFRTFLRDVYLDGKEHRGLSYRGFSRRVGLKSPNYLKRIIDGERNLSDDMAARSAKALALDEEAARYFVDLVHFNQARTATQRNAHYARLTGSRRYRRTRKLELAHAAYHATWYLPVIRELAARQDFRDDAGNTDGDGIPDCSDPCPQDPNNDCIGPCPLDADGDGMKDCGDPCPFGETGLRPCIMASGSPARAVGERQVMRAQRAR